MSHNLWYVKFNGEAASTNKAVDDTKRRDSYIQWKACIGFYFSSSGGRTEDVKMYGVVTVIRIVSVEDKYESGDSGLQLGVSLPHKNKANND